jgi:site-specific recombinase XerD
MTFESVVKEYLVALRQEGKSDATRRNYGWHLGKLFEWLTDQQIDQPDGVSRSLLREWGAELYDYWSTATIKQAVSAAKSFFKWCHEEGLARENVGKALKVPRVKARIQRTLSIEEIVALINACDVNTIKGLRDRALVSLLVDSGLRAGEVCHLEVTDVDLKRGVLAVIGKGGDMDYAHFSPITSEYLGVWLEVRPSLPWVTTLFVAIGGITPHRPLTVRGLRIALKKLGEKAGVPGVSPHAFRRCFACIVTEAGASSRSLQLFGRWEDIRMVERYTRALKAAKLYPQYSPMSYIEKMTKWQQPRLFEQ